MKKLLIATLLGLTAASAQVQAKTLLVYYSFTGNIEKAAVAVKDQTSTDVIQIQPAQKGLNYAANNPTIILSEVIWWTKFEASLMMLLLIPPLTRWTLTFQNMTPLSSVHRFGGAIWPHLCRHSCSITERQWPARKSV